MIILIKEEESNNGVDRGEEGEEIVWKRKLKQLTLHSLVGLTSRKTFMLWGKIPTNIA